MTTGIHAKNPVINLFKRLDHDSTESTRHLVTL
jgi:hypothetical protein